MLKNHLKPCTTIVQSLLLLLMATFPANLTAQAEQRKTKDLQSPESSTTTQVYTLWCLFQSCHIAAASLQGRHLKQTLFKCGTWCPHSSPTFSLLRAPTKQTEQPTPRLCINSQQISAPKGHWIMEHSQGWGAGLRELQRPLDPGCWVEAQMKVYPSSDELWCHRQPRLRLRSEEHLTNPHFEHHTQMSSHEKPSTSNFTRTQMNH